MRAAAARAGGNGVGHDVVAAAVVTTLLIPAGMGYAEASGLPAVTGLYATVVALLAYAAVGPSRTLILGPDSSLAPIIAAAVLPLAAGDPGQATALAGLLAMLSGALLLAGGLLRLGFVMDLLSKPHPAGIPQRRRPHDRRDAAAQAVRLLRRRRIPPRSGPGPRHRTGRRPGPAGRGHPGRRRAGRHRAGAAVRAAGAGLPSGHGRCGPGGGVAPPRRASGRTAPRRLPRPGARWSPLGRRRRPPPCGGRHRRRHIRRHHLKGYHDLERHPEGRRLPGLVIARFDAPLFFANASVFATFVRHLVEKAPEPVSWVVVAAEPVTDIDTTAAEALAALDEELDRRGVHLAFAN